MFHITMAVFALIIVVLIVGKIGWKSHAVINNAINNTSINFQAAEVEILPAKTSKAPHISLQKRIQQKIDYKDSVVRNFAVEHSLLYFDEYYTKYRQICRQFSLIKYIKDNYKYVSDPSGFDYFATPDESIQLMAGDCDDYSILMASTLKSIGSIKCFITILSPKNHICININDGQHHLCDASRHLICKLFKKNKSLSLMIAIILFVSILFGMAETYRLFLSMSANTFALNFMIMGLLLFELKDDPTIFKPKIAILGFLHRKKVEDVVNEQ